MKTERIILVTNIVLGCTFTALWGITIFLIPNQQEINDFSFRVGAEVLKKEDSSSGAGASTDALKYATLFFSTLVVASGVYGIRRRFSVENKNDDKNTITIVAAQRQFMETILKEWLDIKKWNDSYYNAERVSNYIREIQAPGSKKTVENNPIYDICRKYIHVLHEVIKTSLFDECENERHDFIVKLFIYQPYNVRKLILATLNYIIDYSIGKEKRYYKTINNLLRALHWEYPTVLPKDLWVDLP